MGEMTPKERFITAINGGRPDKVPMFDYLFSRDLYERVIGVRPKIFDYRLAIDLAVALKHDAVWAPTLGAKKFVPDDQTEPYQDEWGTTYKPENTSWPLDGPCGFPVKCKDDFLKINVPDASDPGRYAAIIDAVEYSKDHGQLAVMGSLLGPFSLAWLLLGPEYLLVSMYEEPDFIKMIFDVYVNEYAATCIRMNAECGIDCMIIAEDLGYRSGVFYSPAMMRENLFPYLKEMVDLIHSLKLPVFLHCDGNVNAILDDIVETGFDALHPLERKSDMDIRRIKEKYGDRICLVGNVDSCEILARGTLEQVEEQTLECLKYGAEGGGYVLASDHSLSEGVNIDNVLKMCEVREKFGTYPITL